MVGIHSQSFAPEAFGMFAASRGVLVLPVRAQRVVSHAPPALSQQARPRSRRRASCATPLTYPSRATSKLERAHALRYANER
jgi:hypothetical protein